MAELLQLFMESRFVSTKVPLTFTGSAAAQIGNVNKIRSMALSKRQKMNFPSSTRMRQRTGRLLPNHSLEPTSVGKPPSAPQLQR